ncbi:MAG TPA: LacI family DNA-binding transcriptional regulator [Rhizobacter sp.]
MTKKNSPTLAELAAAAGVSTMSASRAVNLQPGVSPQTRETILKLAAEMGYVANRSAQKASGGRSRMLGVLARELDNAYTSALVSGAVRAAAVAGHEVLIYSLADRTGIPDAGVLKLLQQFTEGLIAVLPYQNGFVQKLASTGFPVITIDHHHEHNDWPSVTSDSYGGARAAMQHLAELGHRRIAFITGNEELGSARARHQAYDDAVAIHGLDKDPALVQRGDFSTRGGRDAMQRLLKLKHRPTAVFAANDRSAFGAISVLQGAGLRIPQDMSIVGFDDVPSASQLHPALTTVRQPISEMGRAAVNSLLGMVAGLEVATPRITLPTELQIRQSTAAVARDHTVSRRGRSAGGPTGSRSRER